LCFEAEFFNQDVIYLVCGITNNKQEDLKAKYRTPKTLPTRHAPLRLHLKVSLFDHNQGQLQLVCRYIRQYPVQRRSEQLIGTNRYDGS